MKIKYKLIEHERMEDAPFIGALISSCDCKFNCFNCFNQGIKDRPTIEKEANEIIMEIKSDTFNKGIIFAGLEWSLQKEELYELLKVAKENNLLTCVYTGYDLNTDYVQSLITETQVDYIKYGRYVEELRNPHDEYGVTLISSNQHIWCRSQLPQTVKVCGLNNKPQVD